MYKDSRIKVCYIYNIGVNSRGGKCMKKNFNILFSIVIFGIMISVVPAHASSTVNLNKVTIPKNQGTYIKTGQKQEANAPVALYSDSWSVQMDAKITQESATRYDPVTWKTLPLKATWNWGAKERRLDYPALNIRNTKSQKTSQTFTGVWFY